jgi:hypothetical protein
MILYSNILPDFFCQQPRFVIHSPGFRQRSPVSIYMNYDAKKNMTYYIISGPESEECIQSFKSILDQACHEDPEPAPDCPFLLHPLEAHITLSKILFESSKGYMNLFRQSMFAQVRQILFPSWKPSPTDDSVLAAPSSRRALRARNDS